MLVAPAQRPAIGVLLMLAGTAFLSWNDAVAKHVSQSLPVGQVVCLRQLVALCVVLAVGLASEGWRAFRIGDAPTQGWRGLAFVGSTFLMVGSLAVLPLSIVTAIAFASPLLVAVLSGPLLGERVTVRRWLAALVGFLGVLLIVRPGGVGFEWLLLLPVAAAFASAIRDTLSRKLARTDSALSILFWSSAMVVVAAGTTSLGGTWRGLDMALAAWLLLNGALNAAAHFLILTSYRHADAALVSPLRYTGLVWALLLGWIVWRHLPDAMALTGSFIVVAASLYAAEIGKRPMAGAPLASERRQPAE